MTWVVLIYSCHLIYWLASFYLLTLVMSFIWLESFYLLAQVILFMDFSHIIYWLESFYLLTSHLIYWLVSFYLLTWVILFVECRSTDSQWITACLQRHPFLRLRETFRDTKSGVRAIFGCAIGRFRQKSGVSRSTTPPPRTCGYLNN